MKVKVTSAGEPTTAGWNDSDVLIMPPYTSGGRDAADRENDARAFDVVMLHRLQRKRRDRDQPSSNAPGPIRNQPSSCMGSDKNEWHVRSRGGGSRAPWTRSRRSSNVYAVDYRVSACVAHLERFRELRSIRA